MQKEVQGLHKAPMTYPFPFLVKTGAERGAGAARRNERFPDEGENRHDARDVTRRRKSPMDQQHQRVRGRNLPARRRRAHLFGSVRACVRARACVGICVRACPCLRWYMRAGDIDQGEVDFCDSNAKIGPLSSIPQRRMLNLRDAFQRNCTI